MFDQIHDLPPILADMTVPPSPADYVLDPRTERRIVLVVGAGASTNLGADGRPIPMMPGWAAALVGTLGPRAEQIGLLADLAGIDFEKKLGDFLAFERALPEVEALAWLGTAGSPTTGITGETQGWFDTARTAINQIQEGLRASLWENFGLGRVDQEAARNAYRQVVDLLSSTSTTDISTRIAFVTTNYDPAIEVALDGRLADGFVTTGGYGTPVYHPQNLAGGWTNPAFDDRFPLIHLHGAVGWYQRNDGTFIRLPTDEPFDNRRTPGLLLPDSRKDPGGFSAAHQETWRAFEELLGGATHVMFIGHGLNDAHVVSTVRAAGRPTAVMTYVGGAKERGFPPVPQDEKERIWSHLPNAHVFAGEIGSKSPGGWTDQLGLRNWIELETHNSQI